MYSISSFINPSSLPYHYTYDDFNFDLNDEYTLILYNNNLQFKNLIIQELLERYKIDEYQEMDEYLDKNICLFIKIYIVYHYSKNKYSDLYKMIHQNFSQFDKFGSSILTYAKIHYR